MTLNYHMGLVVQFLAVKIFSPLGGKTTVVKWSRASYVPKRNKITLAKEENFEIYCHGCHDVACQIYSMFKRRCTIFQVGEISLTRKGPTATRG